MAPFDPFMFAPAMPRRPMQAQAQPQARANPAFLQPGMLDPGILNRPMTNTPPASVPAGMLNPNPLQPMFQEQTMGATIRPQMFEGGGVPGTMANARQQEIDYANQPIPGTMANARQQEIAYANGPPPVQTAGDDRNMQPQERVPLPPVRPDEFKDKGQMFMVDYGDGSVLRPFFAKDGKMPEIPGATVFADGGGGSLGGILSGLFNK